MAFRSPGDSPQQRSQHEPQQNDGKADWRGVLLGLAAASGAGLILVGPAIRVFVAFSGPGRVEGSPSGFAEALLVASLALLVFFYGGYATGRVVKRSGIRHGVLVPALTLGLATALALLTGTAGLCSAVAGSLVGGNSPGVLRGVEPLLSAAPLILAAVLSGFPGGAFGGACGAGDGRKERNGGVEPDVGHERHGRG